MIAKTEKVNYYITVSVAYLAASTSLNIPKQPWLHTRLLSITKQEADKRHVAWYAVTYVWDTREIVDWQEVIGQNTSTMRWTKAIDNAKPLRDTKHLVPNWAMSKLSKHSELEFEPQYQ